jgi:hypothetical protein
MNDITALREALATPPPGGSDPDLATLTRAGRRLRRRRWAIVGGGIAVVATAAVVTPMLVAGGPDPSSSVANDSTTTSPTTSTDSTNPTNPATHADPDDLVDVGQLIEGRAEALLPGLEVDQSFPDDLVSSKDPSAPDAPINYNKVVGWHVTGTTPTGTAFYVLASWSEAPAGRDCALMFGSAPGSTCTIGVDAEGRRLDLQEGPAFPDNGDTVRIAVSYREGDRFAVLVREKADASGEFAYTMEQLTALAVDDEIEAVEPDRLPDRKGVAY